MDVVTLTWREIGGIGRRRTQESTEQLHDPNMEILWFLLRESHQGVDTPIRTATTSLPSMSDEA